MSAPLLDQIPEATIGQPGWNSMTRRILERANRIPEIAMDSLAQKLIAGTGLTMSYNTASRTLTLSAAGGAASIDEEALMDFLAARLLAGSGVSKVYDDGTGEITFSASGGGGSSAPAPFPAPADFGFKAWAFDPAIISNTQAPTAGQIALVRMDLRDEQSIAGLTMRINTTAGAGLSNSFVGLYNSAGNRVGLSADQSTAWQSTGEKAPNFTAPAVCPAGAWYGAILIGAGTTLPTFVRAALSTGNSMGLSAPYRFGTFGTGLTALPASIDLSQVAQSQNSYFVGMR